MTPQREANGYWKKGQSGNPAGRAPKATELRLLERMRQIVEPELEAVTNAVLARAKRGDERAARLLYEYVLGKPTQPVDMKSDNITRIIVVHERSDDQDTGAAQDPAAGTA
jgi:hypothetical protein